MSVENTENKRTIREASRWLRVGFFALTVLGPVINSLTARLRDLADARQNSATNNAASTYESGYTEPTLVKPALSASLLELKDRPYAQEVLRRSEELAGELRKRGVTLSQVLTERGGKVTHDLAELSSELTHDLVERGNKTSRELLKRSEKTARKLAQQGRKTSKTFDRRSEKLAKELTRRGEQIAKELNERGRTLSRDLAQRNDTRLTVMGFGVGLVAAAIGAYVLVTRRVQQRVEQDQHILLSQNGHFDIHVDGMTSEDRPANVQIADVEEDVLVAVLREEPSLSETEQIVPTDAVLLGVVSTKRYYPIETPLDEILSPQEGEADIVYFRSDDEARTQGYLPA
jgi:hypothetical protein